MTKRQSILSLINRDYLLRVLGLIVAYSSMGVMVLVPIGEGSGTIGNVVWPSSGIAVAGLLLAGRSVWIGVTLGAALTTLITGGGGFYVVATAAGNTLEALAAVWLLERIGFDRRLCRVRDVAWFALIGLGAAAISALFGVSGLYWERSLSEYSALRIAWLWTMGHAMGTLAVAPVVLTLQEGIESVFTGRRWLEASALMAGLVAVGMAAFRGFVTAPLEYLPFPFLLWAAFRFGPPGAAAAAYVLTGIALSWTALGWGPFAGDSTTVNQMFTWVYTDVTVVTTLLVAAVVAEGKRAETKRKRRDAEYRLLIEQAADGIVVLNVQGDCVEVNSAACEMWGYERDELLGRDFGSMIEPKSRNAALQQMRALLPGLAGIFEWTLLRKDGGTFPAEVSAKRFDDGRLQAFVRDITDRRNIAARLQQSQKMESIGLLAGGIAHEFNNVLTIIHGHSDIAREALEENSRAVTSINRVIEASERASLLTRQLLAFARKQPFEPKTITLDDIVSEISAILPKLLGERIHYATKPLANPWSVRVDPARLQQVLVNMAINARDAMTEGGEFTLECRNVRVGTGSSARNMDLPPGDYATLVVSDTGPGLPPEVAARVFEPFFTTKSRAEGTGLGLAVSYGIVKQAGGTILVESAPGKGATFQILIPRAPAAKGEGMKSDSQERAEPVATERRAKVLLIEDEPGIRDVAVEVLNAHRYRVLVAPTAERALSFPAAELDTLDLVVSDVVLPGMSGPEAVRKLRGRVEGLRVLYISGYPEDRIAAEELQRVGTGFLAKPFKPSDLITAVQVILDDADHVDSRF